MSHDVNQNGTLFALEKIYLKDVSYEAPNVPQVFMEKGVPDVNVQLAIEPALLNADEGLFEVVLGVTVTAVLAGKTVFLAEAKQGGIFRIHGVAEAELPRALEIGCPTVLLPFAREAINELVVKGGFPQLLVNPVNFEALYEQKRAAPADAH